MDRNPIVSKWLVFGIICLFLLTSVPVMSSSEMPLIDEKNEPVKKGGLIDNVSNECYGTYLTDIPFILLGIRVNYIRIEHKNYNEIPVYIDIHVKLETRNGRLLIEFDHDREFQTDGPGMTSLCLFTRYDWKYFKYRFGSFDITLDVTIREDGSHETLVFHGFIYGVGVVIFNPKGEIIETTFKG
jgi:hypothetical protein